VTNAFVGKNEKYNDLKSLYIGGAEVYLQELITRVLEKCFDQIIVLQNGPLTLNINEKTSVRPLHLDVHPNKDDLLIINGLQKNIFSRFRRLAKDRASNIIAIHHGIVDVSMSLMPRDLNIYWYYKSLFLDSLDSNRSALKETSLFALFILRSQLKRYYNLFTLNKLSGFFNNIVSVDKFSLKYILSPSLRKKWVVIYNSVNLNLFNPNVKSINTLCQDSVVNILVPRNLNIQRGVFILPNLALCLMKNGFKNFRFLVAGTGYLKKYLEQSIRLKSLDDKIILLGHKDHYHDMPSLYASSDIVLVPSFSSEGTSLSVLEGMASKKPVVTADTGGIKDIGLNNIHKLSSNFDQYKIARNILKLVENRKLAEDIAENGFQYVHKFHDITDWSRKWQSLLLSLIRQPH
jgi:glycosyltransferase involved in cell wall biosynthesis